jgi:general secretion pathway protein E
MKELLLKTAEKTGFVPASELENWLRQNEDDPRPLDEVLLGNPAFTEDAVLRLIADSLEVEFIEELDPKQVPKDFVNKVNAVYAQQHFIIGYQSDEDEMMTVITGHPFDIDALDSVSRMIGVPLEQKISTKANITAAIDVAYEQKDSVVEEVAEELDSQNINQLMDEAASSDDLLDVVNRPPVIRLVNDIFFRALQMRASDIHIHPFESKIQVRYRVDGILYDALSLNRNILPLVISRIKVMAGMDIAERRMPQDGRTSVRMGQREIDLRVSTVPTSFGERCVLRILDKSAGIFKLEELGMWPDDLEIFDRILHRSHGVIFVTGPTGSGKSTTLYASLNRLNSTEKNIMTVENPIEYQLEGISQMQVSEKKGITFITALRHILRQDPDIIMVGEVRDQETSRMAIQSSLTGHLVFSTVHTNDSAGTVSRLIDLGVEPYLVSSSLIAVLAQRLVRRICPYCKKETVPTERELFEMGTTQSDMADSTFYVGQGCEKCFNTGYRGRIGIYELMLMRDELRDLINAQESAGVIKRKALELGLKTLRMDGLRKVKSGQTTISEVLRVTQSDMV